MRERPVLAAAGNFFRLRMNRNHTSAGERADIGPALLIEREIPASNRLAPVSQSPGKGAPPFCPIGGVVRTGVIWPALGPMHFGVGMSFTNLGNHADVTGIAVPSYCAGVLAHIRIVEFANDPAPKIVVVVKQPDLRWNPIVS